MGWRGAGRGEGRRQNRERFAWRQMWGLAGPWVYQTRIQTSQAFSFLLPHLRDWLWEAHVPRVWAGALVAPHRPRTCHSLVAPWPQALSLRLYCRQLGHLSHRAGASTVPR